MRVSELRAHHVTKWLKTYKGIDTYKNGACRAVSRAFNWARKQSLLAVNPISGMDRPAATSREEYLTLDQWKALLELVPKGDFRDLILFLWETGARPYEARAVASENYIDGRFILERKDTRRSQFP
jgi:integrase